MGKENLTLDKKLKLFVFLFQLPKDLQNFLFQGTKAENDVCLKCLESSNAFRKRKGPSLMAHPLELTYSSTDNNLTLRCYIAIKTLKEENAKIEMEPLPSVRYIEAHHENN